MSWSCLSRWHQDMDGGDYAGVNGGNGRRRRNLPNPANTASEGNLATTQPKKT